MKTRKFGVQWIIGDIAASRFSNLEVQNKINKIRPKIKLLMPPTRTLESL
jgi:hypothetical protein